MTTSAAIRFSATLQTPAEPKAATWTFLVLPAAAARNVSGGMRSYHGLSILFSLFSGVTGLILSYYLGTSAGGTICLVAAVLFFLTYLGNRVKARN